MDCIYYYRTLISLLKQRPFILYHKPTLSCNCKCKFCDFWKKSTGEDDSLPTEIVLKMIEDGAKLGFSSYAVWGGEPLIVKDIGLWLKKAKELHYKTSMCTAGYLLEERFDDIKDNIDIILLSLEAVSNAHDEIRRTPGLFSRIDRAVDLFKNTNVLIKIWANISALNKDQVFNIIQFAEKKNLIVEFFPTSVMDNYNENIIFDPDERYKVFTDIIRYKKRGYPVNNSVNALKIMREWKPFICNLPKNSVHVNNKGTILPCETRFIEKYREYGNLMQEGMQSIFKNKTFQHNREQLKHCNECIWPCVAEQADNLLLQSLRGAFESLMKNKR